MHRSAGRMPTLPEKKTASARWLQNNYMHLEKQSASRDAQKIQVVRWHLPKLTRTSYRVEG
jgi:hypothetical protein